MNLNVSGCSFCLLLLLNLVGGKPVSDLQSLKQLLEEEMDPEPSYSSEEVEVQGRDVDSDKSAFGGAPAELQLRRSSNPSDPSNSALARLLKDLLRTSKRSWSRYKKGGLRSCFGVRLERIGSFSGLGC